MTYIRESKAGLFYIYLRSSSFKDLAKLLDPEVPIVHLCNYQPKGDTNWWSLNLPLTKASACRPLRIRSLAFDVEFSTRDFLDDLAEFGSPGVDLLHLRKSLAPNVVPQLMRRLPPEELTKILIASGMEARFALPHAGEFSLFSSRSRRTIEKALEDENIRARCIASDQDLNLLK